MELTREQMSFAAVNAGLAIYVAIGTFRDAEPPVLTLLCMLVLAGAAYAPDRWREVAPLAGLSTAVFLVVFLGGAVAVNGIAALTAHPINAWVSIVFGLYMMNLVMLSIGYATFRLTEALMGNAT